MDDSDILSFGNSRKISFKAALRSVQSNRPKIKASTIVENSSSDSNNSDDEDESRRNRKRIQHKVGGKVGSLASRLIHNQLEPCVISSDSDDSDLESGSKKKVKKKSPSPPSSGVSRSPSPEPSPPPPGAMATPTNQASKRVLNKASNALHQLMYSAYTPGYSDTSYCSDHNDSLVRSASKESITLRVRYRGNICRFTINKGDPLSLVCSMLASEVAKSEEANRFLLSHKTTTLSVSESPLSLGLTTADIIDAIQLSEATTSNEGGSLNLSTGDNNIQIKVQTSKKSKMYSLSKTDPLKKAMEAFAKELNVAVSKLSFSFDGDPISPLQTALDLDMENEDCIDARYS